MTIWYIARGSGLAALVLLSLTTAIGAVLTGRSRRPAVTANRVVVNYLHRVTTTLGLGALLLHLGAILADSFAHVSLSGALVPFTAGYRPTWVGVGTLAIYTFVLVAATGVARGRFAASARAARAWRWVHGLAYAGWFMALLHGLKSGTDTSVGWVRVLYLACAVAVFSSVAVRIAMSRNRPDLVRQVAAPVAPAAPAPELVAAR